MLDLKEGGFWQGSPDFLAKHSTERPIRSDFRTDKVEGEKQPKNVHMVFTVTKEGSKVMDELLKTFSSAKKLFRIVAFMMNWVLPFKSSKIPVWRTYLLWR